jgi:hypothetical protein
MNDKEKYYISFYNTLSPNGYNLTLGGSNCKQLDETKLLKSISMIGKNKIKFFLKEKELIEKMIICQNILDVIEFQVAKKDVE